MTDTATARVNVNVPTVLWERFYGVQPNGTTVPVPALQVLPNVQVRYA